MNCIVCIAVVLTAEPTERPFEVVEAEWVEVFEVEQDRRIEDYASSMTLPSAEPRLKNTFVQRYERTMELSRASQEMIDEMLEELSR